jgi:hypothetical protein
VPYFDDSEDPNDIKAAFCAEVSTRAATSAQKASAQKAACREQP